MPRKIGTGRGTRHPRGIRSGTTFEVMNGGVTIDTQGIHYTSGTFISPTEWGVLASAGGPILSAATKPMQFVHGTVGDQENALTTPVSGCLKIATGLTTLTAFWCTPIQTAPYITLGGGVSYYAYHINGSQVSVICHNARGASSTINNGTSIHWIAFGT